MLVMDKVVALIALAVAKKASAYAVVRVSEQLLYLFGIIYTFTQLYLYPSKYPTHLLLKVILTNRCIRLNRCCRFFFFTSLYMDCLRVLITEIFAQLSFLYKLL